MNPNIPIPTDSVHKFYAGFGLVVFIASLIAAVYIHNSTNEKVMNWFEESVKLEKLEKMTEVDIAHLKRIEELIDITKKDRTTFLYFLFSSSFFGLFVAGWGFQAWEKKIQPLLDKKMELELELLELEIASKKRSNNQLHRTRYTRR